MVNPLSFLNKVINKARGLSPTSPPPRTNPKPQYKPIPKAPNEPISKIESVTSTPLVKRNVMPDPTDELIKNVKNKVLKKDLIDRLDFTPNQFGLKNSGNTKARDFDTFINRPDIPEVKDIAKGSPSGKHLDYWSLGKTRPGSNRTPANDYHDFLMGRDPQKEYKTKVLKGTMEEKIRDMKRYPGLYKKLKKANPGLSDRQLVKKMELLMDDGGTPKDSGVNITSLNHISWKPVGNQKPSGLNHIAWKPVSNTITAKAKTKNAVAKKAAVITGLKNKKDKGPSWWQKFNTVNYEDGSTDHSLFGKAGKPTGYAYGILGNKKKVKTISFPKKKVGKRRQQLNKIGSNFAKFSDDPFFFWQPKDR